MNYFYFFKVTLSYFDDERTTFFITPDQSETDEQGVPFSESDLRSTVEFKDLVKKTKADIIDVDYTEYALEYDPKKSDILTKPVTSDSFAELEKSGLLEIIDENQFPIILKKAKKQSDGSKLPVVCIIIAAVIVLAVFAYGELSKRSIENETPDISDVSEALELSSEEVSDNSNEDKISDTSSDANSSDVTESDNNTSTNSENTHEVTSTPESSASANESDGNSSDSAESTAVGETSNTEISEADIFNNDSPSNMAVTIYYDVEEPSVYFVDPNGNINLGSSYTVDRSDKAVCYYIPNAIAGQWLIGCDKKGNTTLNVNWASYGAQPQIGEV